MEGRGRKSSASLTVISSNPVSSHKRPNPPAELTSEQAEEWIAVVNRLPADWFPRETHSVLVSFVRHVVRGRHIAQLINKLEGANELNVGEYDRLCKMAERESRAEIACARTMRLTQHSTILPTKQKPQVIDNPWDDE